MSSPHVSDELPRLLSGEASRDVVLDAAAHLRTCIDCQQELVSAVVAHASLSSAQRFAPEIVAGAPQGGDDDAPLPDLSSLFAQVRQEASSPLRHPTSRRRYLFGAVAAAVVLGGGATAAVLATSGDSTPAGRTVALVAYDEGTTSASATLSGDRMSLNASSLPKLAGKGYEVWLTNSQRTVMKPVGWLSANGTATIDVPAALMAKYSDIEVSVQDVNSADYLYSKHSVLRGAYS